MKPQVSDTSSEFAGMVTTVAGIFFHHVWKQIIANVGTVNAVVLKCTCVDLKSDYSSE